MTLLTLIDTVPSDRQDYLVQVNGVPVWDYKLDSDNKLYLISENLFDNDFTEYVGFNELCTYIQQNDLFPHSVKLICEFTGEELTNYQWENNALLLGY